EREIIRKSKKFWMFDIWGLATIPEDKRVIRICKKAGVKYFRFHALRHFGASLLDQKNVTIGTIQRILGHENRKTTEIYLHSFGEAERHAMEIFDEIFSEKSHTSLTQRVAAKKKNSLKVS
ncbi:tyrosine-type recombinase/integrase, partial [Thermodesulfobacteriota bacterium]